MSRKASSTPSPYHTPWPGVHGPLCGFFPLERAGRYKGLPVPMARLWKHVHCFLGTPQVRAGHAHECLNALLDWLLVVHGG